jgi:methionine-rich copper-binding protein CopC
MPDAPKKARNSKTIAINVLTLIVAAAAAVAGTDVIQEYPQAAAAITAAVAGINIVIRFLTSKPIEGV